MIIKEGGGLRTVQTFCFPYPLTPGHPESTPVPAPFFVGSGLFATFCLQTVTQCYAFFPIYRASCPPCAPYLPGVPPVPFPKELHYRSLNYSDSTAAAVGKCPDTAGLAVDYMSYQFSRLELLAHFSGVNGWNHTRNSYTRAESKVNRDRLPSYLGQTA